MNVTHSEPELPKDVGNSSGGKKKERGVFASFLIYILIGLTIAFGVRMVVEPTVVVGSSMMPNLEDGEYLLNLKVFMDLEYGDVVIVDTTEADPTMHFIIKRVIGLPGDTIEIKNNEVFRNGEKLVEDYIDSPMVDNEDVKVEIGEDEVWVMGDNRNNSLDSRVIGPVSVKEEVRGEVVLRLFPFDQSFKEGNFELTDLSN